MGDDAKLPRKCRLFCDLDGVLCDFEGGVQALFGRGSDQIREKEMWSRIQAEEDFFANLQWTADGQKLWEHIQSMCAQHPGLFASPQILTGVPRGDASKMAKTQKIAWCQRNLGLKPKNVLCVQTSQKHHYSGPFCVYTCLILK